MSRMKIPVGVSDFSEIRRKGYYYIDKTGLIRQLLKSEGVKVTLLTRPRRFGKTIAMSMLAHFFDIREDSGKLFEGLEIANERELCEKWMNQYPVLFLTFKDVDGLNFASAKEMLINRISALYLAHDYLEHSERVSEIERKRFRQIVNAVDEGITDAQLKTSLLFLMNMMKMHYGKPVILLLDEYDVPVAKASSNGYYDQMMEVIRIMMSTALKDNPSLLFAVVTGCLRIAKESIFTGTNNFVADTIASTRLQEYFGFTQEDVSRVLTDTGLAVHADKIRTWYDGYRFGDCDVYCPWDVMNYVHDLILNPEARPVSYWKNTSSNEIIRTFIDFAGSSITMKLETLLDGGYIVQKIEEGLTYDYLHSSEDHLWSILYLTGYLTGKREAEIAQPLRDGEVALVIPNAEIRDIFETTIVKWFDDSARTWNRKALFAAVWSGDCNAIQEEMNRLLRKTISYHDYREDFYHAFLAGIFTGAGYAVESNKEHGEGRSDVVIFDPVNGRAAVFEAKYSRSFQMLASDCEKAVRQIDKRMYAKEFEDDFDEVFCYGIAFFKKRCAVGT